MITREIKEFMSLYLQKDKKTNKNSKYYELLCKKIPHLIKSHLNNDIFKIKGSTGNAKTADVPWICIMNKNMTTSPQKGIYIAILFNKQMDTFYICLEIGVDFFWKNKKYKKYLPNFAKFLYEQIKPQGYLNHINLGSKLTRPKGYEKATICAKPFNDNFSDKDIYDAIDDLKFLYDWIVDKFGTNFDEIAEKYIKQISPEFYYEPSYTALDKINKDIGATNARLVLQSVEPPINNKNKRFGDFMPYVYEKIDYLKKAEQNGKVGEEGEKYVLEYELKRLSDLIQEYFPSAKEIKNKIYSVPDLKKDFNLNELVQRVSLDSDSFGHDIKSININKNGEISDIYIEVKTTSQKNIDASFFISSNEKKFAKEHKGQYYLYRVYDLKNEPKVYIVDDIESKFELEPYSYIARIK